MLAAIKPSGMAPGAAAVVGTEGLSCGCQRALQQSPLDEQLLFLQEINAFPQAFSTSQALSPPLEDPIGAAVLYVNRYCPFKKCDVRHYLTGHTLSVLICQQA